MYTSLKRLNRLKFAEENEDKINDHVSIGDANTIGSGSISQNFVEADVRVKFGGEEVQDDTTNEYESFL